MWPLGWYVRLPEGIQQEFPFKRALLGVKGPLEEDAESWKSVMFPSSIPRPCRHTVSSQITNVIVKLQETWRLDFKLLKWMKEWEDEPTFLFTAIGDLEIFGNSGAGVHLHVGVRKAEGTVVTYLSIVRKDTVHCAASYRTIRIDKLQIWRRSVLIIKHREMQPFLHFNPLLYLWL